MGFLAVVHGVWRWWRTPRRASGQRAIDEVRAVRTPCGCAPLSHGHAINFCLCRVPLHDMYTVCRPSIIILLLGSIIMVATVTAVASSIVSIATGNATDLWHFDVDICPTAEQVATNATTAA